MSMSKGLATLRFQKIHINICENLCNPWENKINPKNSPVQNIYTPEFPFLF